MNREQAHVNATPMNDAGTSQGSTTNSMISSNSINNVDWSGTHVQFYQAEEMRDWILLDNESTASIFCNKNYLQDIQENSEELVLSTNGGGLKTKLTA
jgi:pullulanase/glycogen debranching enzyme